MKNLFTSFAATVIIQLANMATGVLAARFLLPEGRGLLGLAMLWPTLFATVGFLNIDQGVTCLLATRHCGVRTLLTTALTITGALAAATVFTGYFVLPLLIGQSGDALTHAHLFLLFIPLNFVGAIAIGLASGMQQYNWWNV